jgi:lincosamide nucleotidyltransferase
VQKYLLWLIRARTNKTKHWESPTKSLEKDIDTIWYSAYKTVTSDLNPKNIVFAFENSLNLSEKLFDELNIEPKLKEILHEIRKNYR